MGTANVPATAAIANPKAFFAILFVLSYFHLKSARTLLQMHPRAHQSRLVRKYATAECAPFLGPSAERTASYTVFFIAYVSGTVLEIGPNLAAKTGACAASHPSENTAFTEPFRSAPGVMELLSKRPETPAIQA